MDVLKCHLKDVSRERQTPLDQDLISTCYKIFPWKQNFSIRKRTVFQLPNFANRLLKQWSQICEKIKACEKVKLAPSTASSGLNNTLRGNRKLQWTVNSYFVLYFSSIIFQIFKASWDVKTSEGSKRILNLLQKYQPLILTKIFISSLFFLT